MDFLWRLLIELIFISLVSGLECSQCSSQDWSSCRQSPPAPQPCPGPQYRFCLTLKEYHPSLSDDADANLDDKAGSLIFLARTCVQENLGDNCSDGERAGSAVTVCRSHCDWNGCNSAWGPSQNIIILWGNLLLLLI